MKSSLFIAMLCLCLSSKAQLTGSMVINDSKDTSYIVAEFLYSSPDFTYFKLHDTIYKLETRYFVNSTGFRQIPITTYEQQMYDAFKSAKTSVGLALTGVGVILASSLFLVGEEPKKDFYTAGVVAGFGIGIASFVSYMNFINRGMRANEKVIAVPYDF